MLNFGQKIKKLRTDAGLSQAMLAEHIGVSVQSISNWECNNTMPDISQIVPLASILCVSTDYLLGVGFDEKADHETLIRNVNTVWANYSVNTKENNADLLVANLYKEYLRKYPTDYEVKYKCALALYDYLLVGKVRGKFHIEADTYESIYTRCKLMLSSICNNTLVIELQINANQLMIELLLLDDNFDKALHFVEMLPGTCGIKCTAQSKVLYAQKAIDKANQVKLIADKEKCLDYLRALYESAISGMYGKDKSILVLEHAESIAKTAVSLYLDVTTLDVNSYEKMPYCYLITAYTMMCKMHLLNSDYDAAYTALDKAAKTACEMFAWVKGKTKDEEVLADYKFFAEKTPHWAFSFSGLYSSEDNDFTKSEQYKNAVKEIEKVLYDA
ncbi:MAG: helix-turn-helix transcriptional regulator [Clostridia bacterium]|nr:helix-turn-helix transcriptional regulator [Clostridia bacterium]MBQ8743502.1 helix-turn-helix transcriptional regulator [Clostridia bacterium]